MNARVWFCIAFGVLFVGYLMPQSAPAAAQEQGPIYEVNINGVITSVKVDYLRRALQTAEARDATALIITLSSDGAVLRSIRPFATELAEADVPVVVYVEPSGTESGAAGAFFLSAASIAAMAPDTTFGTPLPLASVDDTLSEQTQELVLDSVVEQLRDWNEWRGRNTNWVDAAVRNGFVRSSGQAIATVPPTIDLVAGDKEELLVLLQGRTVELENGEEVQLETLGRNTTVIEPSLWEQFLLLLTDPTVTFLLLVLGCIALYAELATPGTGIAAGLGAVMLFGAMVGLLVLPVRVISLLGLALAFGLIVTDLYVPSTGAFSIVGLALIVVSALTLVDTTQAPNVVVALWAVLMVVLFVGAVVALGIWLIVRTRGTPIATGQEGLVGRLAQVRQDLDPDGMVFVEGALWRAISNDGLLTRDEWVRVIAVHDLRLVVEPLDAHLELEEDEEPPAQDTREN